MLRSNRSNKEDEDLGEVNNGYTSDIPPTYEDSINHNDIKDTTDKKSLDTIDTLDMDDKEKKDEVGKSDKCRSFISKLTKLSTYDPRNSSMWKETDGDRLHILVLFGLYILQGIPLGLRNSVPLVLQERGVSYTDQSMFSFASYPFSMKILWAPIVDAIFIKRFGRRKTWLIPTQMLIGITMLVLSQYVDVLIGPDPDRAGNATLANSRDNTTNSLETQNDRNQSSSTASSPDSVFKPDIVSLTIAFFFLTFFAATQDVAVDGWALTMLKPKNVGYAATCNSVGQTTGWCLGYILYTVLDDANVIDLSQFLIFWGIVFIVTTAIIAIFKKEKNQQLTHKNDDEEESGEAPEEEPDLGIIETYKIIWKIICHPLVPPLILFLFTSGIGFTASESITNLRLISAGVPKGRIARVSIWMIPVKIGMTIIITRYTVGRYPMNVWLWCFPFRILLSLAFMVLVYITPLYQSADGSFLQEYYVLMIFIAAIHRAILYGMFVAIMAFFAKISDPIVGGTNMTFFNTLANLGNMWPDTFFLWFVDVITYKDCVPATDQSISSPTIINNSTFANETIFQENFCIDEDEGKICKAAGGQCDTSTDGYYILCLASAAFGMLWLIWAWRTIKRLQEVDIMEWRVTKSKSISCYGLSDIVVKKITGLKR